MTRPCSSSSLLPSEQRNCSLQKGKEREEYSLSLTSVNPEAAPGKVNIAEEFDLTNDNGFFQFSLKNGSARNCSFF